MGNFFTFSDRAVRMQFFDGDEAVVITVIISDKTDAKILKSGEMFIAADKEKDMGKRLEQYRAALVYLIGEDKYESILAKADEADCYAVYSVYQHILHAYGAQKTKNLSASGR
jgi:hypothetical protein